ncbi:hypothetical protein ACFLS8_04765 [Chloroflexota bacterium]
MQQRDRAGQGGNMQIRKTYNAVNPRLLYDEIRDFVLKQGTTLSESGSGIYLLPDNTSEFMFRGSLTFQVKGEPAGVGRECLRAHIVGTVRDETKVMLDINDELFSSEKVAALQDDVNFIFRTYEAGIDDEET